MAEISLKEYLARVDNLLKEQASDEVVHHCRHILQYYPKNVAAYRYLGVALTDRSRWNDVAEVFRRVLSAYPDDETAHLGLSEAYEHTGKYDDAIWHLERAFEQEPNNDEIVSKLRELYRQHRNTEYAKVQLTAGAVARQYARNGLYDQAIDTLQQALERTPDRFDLRLLLAQMLWESGYHLDAAETALDVLRTLPDCLQANRILTELWLSEGRPSDAQRYLSRIEALDPYQALELAHGQPPPDDVLRLQELDYERAAKRELTTAAPDWIGQLDSSDTSDWMASFRKAPAQQTETGEPTSDLLETALPEDWLTDINTPTVQVEQPPASAVPPPRRRTGVTGLLSSLDLPEPAPEEELPSFEDEMVSADLVPVEPEETPGDDMLDLFPVESEEAGGEAAPDLFQELEAAQPTPGSAPADTDPFAWLQQSGIELVEDSQSAAPDLFGEDEEFVLQEPDKVNPLGWLESYGGEEIVADEGGIQPPDDQGADPLAWLHQDGVETLDEEPRAVSDVQASTSQADAQDEALLDWLADDTVLDEMLHMEALSTGASKPQDVEPPSDEFVAAEAGQEVEMPDDNEFNWLNEQQPEEQPSAEDSGLDRLAQPDEQPAPTEEPDLDWLAEPASQPNMPEWMSEAPASPEPPQLIEDTRLEWMAETEAEPEPAASDTSDWLSEMMPAEEPVQAADTGLEWMSEAEPEAAIPAETPDWLAAAAPTSEPQTADAGFDWLSESAPATEAAAAGSPDWLSEMQPAGEPEPAQSADASFEWMSEAEAATPADTPDWLAQMAPAEEPEAAQPTDAGLEWIAEPEAVAADTPDWLSALAPTEEPAGEPEPAQPDVGVEWMSEVGAEPAETPDWLAAAAPVEQPSVEAEPAVSSDAGFEWMSEPEAVATTDTPDWLSAMAPAEEPEPAQEADTSFEWMSEAEAVTPADTPDWLAQMAPAEEPEAAQPTDTGFEWSSEAEPEAAVAADAPDWLSQLGPTAEESAPEPVTTSDSPGWLSELAPAEEEEAEEPEALSGEMPDWLTAMAPPQDTVAEMDAVPSGASDFEWDAEWVSADDQPDWLSSLKPEAAEPAAPEPVASEFSWLNEMNTPEEPASKLEDAGYVDSRDLEEMAVAPAPAENAPDWLNAMVPGLDVDYEAPEDSPIETDYVQGATRREEIAAAATPAAREFEWLNQIVAEEALQPEPAQQPAARRRFVFSRQPAWLRRPVERHDAAPLATQQAEDEDDDFPGWLRNDDAGAKDFDLPPWLQ